jgi:choline dehydrogenase
MALDSDLDPADPGGDFPTSRDQDLEALYQGVRMVRDIIRIGKDKGMIESEELPGFTPFNGNVRKWIKHLAWGHHACGTCRIGDDDDEDAVLDSRFRVRGVKGLRVVDASIFPRIPGFFIVANVYMIAEKAADVLSEDHPLPIAALTPEVREARRLDPVLPSSPEFAARRVYPVEMEAAEADLIADRRKKAGL